MRSQDAKPGGAAAGGPATLGNERAQQDASFPDGCSGVRVLVVDDEPSVCTFVARVAERLGFRAHRLSEPERFAAVLESLQPHLLVLDLRMPNVDGIELLRVTAQRSSGTRVIVMSGMDQRVLQAAENHARSTGVRVCSSLQKPLGLKQLEQALAQAVGESVLLKAQDLETAISDRQLVLHYQPKVKRDGGWWVAYGVEALVRWQHPSYGLLLPRKFLPLAEQAGLMLPMTELVLEAALAQAGQWQREGLDLNVALNLPADALRDQSFPDHFRSMLHERGVDGTRITLELTESAAMAHTLDAKDVCLRLRMSGAGLSIDDFGTGFSSLQQLYELPFSELKVDRRFVADLQHNDEAKAIVRATVSLAHALGMTACAEGVESKEVMQYVEAIGCDAVQGYLVARPMAANEVAGFVQQWNRPLADASGSGAG